jgi:hypothetical protein
MQTFKIDDGYLVATEFTANGGITYAREDISSELEDRRLRAEFKTTKRVDDVDVVGESTKLLNRAHNAITRHCTKTPIGYFVSRAKLVCLEDEISQLRIDVRSFNARAAMLGSARRVRAEVYPLQVAMDDERVAARLAETCRERLRGLAAALKAGDRETFESELERCRNLDRLATGIQREAIVDAIDRAKELKRGLLVDLRAGTTPAEAGAKLDVEPIEASEKLFY